MAGGSDPQPPAPAGAFSYAQVDEESFRQQIEGLLRVNNKIEAIKRYRERYGVGLKEAKDAIDTWGLVRRGVPAPIVAPAPPPSGIPAASTSDFLLTARPPLTIPPVPPSPGPAPSTVPTATPTF